MLRGDTQAPTTLSETPLMRSSMLDARDKKRVQGGTTILTRTAAVACRHRYAICRIFKHWCSLQNASLLFLHHLSCGRSLIPWQFVRDMLGRLFPDAARKAETSPLTQVALLAGL